jgi:hypothetical protein
MGTNAGRRLGTVAVLAAVLGATFLPACSSDKGSDGAPPKGSDGTTATTAAARPSPPEQFRGAVDGFYVLPKPLPHGEPGQLIRVQEMGRDAGRVSVRIMYHSRDAQDHDRAVTGVATYPLRTAPADGWPVVSTAHGTTGLAPICAPSRFIKQAPGWGVSDAVWVATDYIGLGPVGELHAYLSRPSEGHSVIDAVRAVRSLKAAHASDRWLSVGHSQGGHGALSAHELAGSYAPELHLLGTLALAPAAMFLETYGGIDPIVSGIVSLMGLYGGATEHPDLDVRDYVKPEVAAKAKVFRTGCLDEITTTFAGLAASGLYTNDPRKTQPAQDAIDQNDVGRTAVKGVPVFLVSGTADERVVIERARALFARMCDAGQVTQLLIVKGADHDSIIGRTSAQTSAWLRDRIAGRPATDSCAST